MKTSRLIAIIAAVGVLATFGVANAASNCGAKSLTEVPADCRDLRPADGSLQAPADRPVGGEAPEGITFYTDRTTFDAANPGLPIEDFEEGNVPPGGVLGCDAPVSSTTNDACWSTGDILPGITIQDNPGPDPLGLVLIGTGFNGNPSIQFASNTFVDTYEVLFNPPVAAVGADIFSQFGADTATINIFDASDVLITSTTAPSTNAGQFWGVASTDPIGRITVFTPTNQAEGFDNLAFGTSVAPAITLDKTVGTVPMTCAATDTITVPLGTTVTYCFFVTNTGNVTLNFHDLFDDHLGTLLSDFPFALDPGSSAFLTQDDTATATVTNTATWTASTTLVPTYRVDDTVPFNFIDISATGTALNLLDDGEANVTMPFSFELFGTASSDLRIGNNGGILFGVTTGDLGFTNAALPIATPANAILPFWDDLDSDTGNVYWQTLGSAPDRQLVVQWTDRPHFPGPGAGGVTLEVILFEGTNEILFQYLDTDFGNPLWDFGASATAGLNLDATTAVQYSFNTPDLTDFKAILFSPGDASATDTATVIIDTMPFLDGFESGDTSAWTVTVP